MAFVAKLGEQTYTVEIEEIGKGLYRVSVDERLGDVVSGHIGDEEVALRRLLDGPHLLGDTRALTTRG